MQETCHTLHSRAATCNGFKISAIIAKVEPTLQLVLHSAIFLATCVPTLEKNPLQVARDMLLVAFWGCNLQWFQKISAIIAKSRTNSTVQFSWQLVFQLWKKIHCKFQETCYMFVFSGCNLQWFQKFSVIIAKCGTNSTASVTQCNFLGNLCSSFGKKIHCKLQETCCSLHSRAATCNGFKKSLQSLQKVEPTLQCNFLGNLCSNSGKKSIASCKRHVTCCILGLQLAMVSKNLCNHCKT